MLTYTIQRIVSGIMTLIALIILTFFLLRLAPGGPFDSEQAWPPEIQANIASLYELDRPVAIQFLHWAQDVVRGDLHESFQYLGHPVKEIIFESLPPSFILGGSALSVSILFGILLGCLSAWKQNSLLDRILMIIAVSGLSLPTFLIASILILIFSLQLGWFPPALWEGPSSMVLPIVTLAWRPMGIIARLIRTSLLESFSSDYIRTAFGKGLSHFQVIYRHALKNSLIPVISILGPLAANLISGSFVVEIIFQIPGLGKHFVQAVLNRDYPLVLGVTLTYGAILILSNLLVDFLYAWADPRIRLGRPETELGGLNS